MDLITKLNQLVTTLNRVISNQEQLDREIRQLQHEGRVDRQRSEIEVVESLLQTQYDRAAQYTTVIIVAGYVAFCSMWSSVRSDLPKPLMMWAGLLMTISIIWFIGFEVARMVLSSVAHHRILAAVRKPGNQIAPTAHRELLDSESRKIYRLWKYALVPMLVTGFGSAGILAWAFIRGLICE